MGEPRLPGQILDDSSRCSPTPIPYKIGRAMPEYSSGLGFTRGPALHPVYVRAGRTTWDRAEWSQSQVLGPHPYTSLKRNRVPRKLPHTQESDETPSIQSLHPGRWQQAALPSCGLSPYCSMRATGQTTELCQRGSHLEHRKDESSTVGEAGKVVGSLPRMQTHSRKFPHRQPSVTRALVQLRMSLYLEAGGAHLPLGGHEMVASTLISHR